MRILFFTLLTFSFIYSAAAEDERQLSAIDGHEFIPTRGMDKCGAFFKVEPATLKVQVTFTGGECVQAHTESILTCPEGNQKCRGDIAWEGCGDRYGHRLGNACLDDQEQLLPLDSIEGWTLLRIFPGAKKVSLTIKNLTANGERINEAATVIVLKRKPE